MATTGSTIAFPHSLRQDIEDGTANHVSFQILGAGLDENIFKIHMYIPQNFAVGDSANFGSLDVGTLNEASRLVKESREEGTIDEEKLEALGLGATLIKNLGLDQFGVSDKKLLDRGIALNQGTTLTFEGASVRQFTFTFKMVAESAEESETMRIIEHTFRKYMYAKKTNEAFLEYPAAFRIKFLKGNKINKHLPRIFDSYLSGVTATYNESGNMFFANGAPSDMTLELSFQEQKQLTRGDLYNIDDVDPNNISQNITYPEVKTESQENPKGDG